jgi:hypothetical protein
MLNRAVAIGMSFALGSLVVFSHSGSAQAQRQSTAQRGVNGYNVTQANYGGGFFRETGKGRWTEYDPDGHASYSFTETGRDEWSVYLDDRSRDVQLQIDIHRNWVTYGTNGGPKSDLYQITAASRKTAAPPRGSAATDGDNVQQVFFAGGSFKKTGPREWTEYDTNGRANYSFAETGRDEWSVYLNDRSRDVQLQLDLYRKWVSYGQNGDGKSDLYRITSSSRRQIATQSPRRTQNTRDVNAGPIWNQRDAESKCPAVAAAQGGQWTGQWRTTVKGKMSVCEIRF